jgi:hypothetical protein
MVESQYLDVYGLASTDKIAAGAGASTRTRDLERLDPCSALTVIADTLVARACDPDSAALFRIMATESHRFPEPAAKMRASDKRCGDSVVANYFRTQVRAGRLALPDSDKAASLFLQMICSEMHECLLFSDETALAHLGLQRHTADVIDMFLLGAAPR